MWHASPRSERASLLRLKVRQEHHGGKEACHKAADMRQVGGSNRRGRHCDDEIDQKGYHHDASQDGPAQEKDNTEHLTLNLQFLRDPKRVYKGKMSVIMMLLGMGMPSDLVPIPT